MSPLGNTPNGMPFPHPSDPISDGADAIKALADAVRIVGVSVTVPANSPNPATAQVVFPPGLFTAAPLVVSSSSSSNGATGLTAVSVDGATLTLTIRGTSGALPATITAAVLIRVVALQIFNTPPVP